MVQLPSRKVRLLRGRTIRKRRASHSLRILIRVWDPTRTHQHLSSPPRASTDAIANRHPWIIIKCFTSVALDQTHNKSSEATIPRKICSRRYATCYKDSPLWPCTDFMSALSFLRFPAKKKKSIPSRAISPAPSYVPEYMESITDAARKIPTIDSKTTKRRFLLFSESAAFLSPGLTLIFTTVFHLLQCSFTASRIRVFLIVCKFTHLPQFRMKVDAVRKVASGHFFEDLWW